MLTEFERECLRDARDMFQDLERIDPYIIGMHNIYGLTRRIPVGKYMDQQDSKEVIVHALISLVHQGASEVIFVSEIWRATGKGKDLKAFEADSVEWIKTHGSLEGFGGVREFVMFSHFSDEGDRLHFARISEDSGSRAIGKWDSLDGDYNSEGRFAGIFKRAREIEGN